jgi:hypothetical protein
VKTQKPGGGTERHATVIPLNRETDSARNTPPPFDGSYATPPPIKPPYGWRLAEKKAGAGWELIHDRQEWGVISWLIQERRAGGDGRSYDALATALQKGGVPAPTGGRSVGRWHGERVRSLILRYAPELATPPRAERGSRLMQLWGRDPDTLSEEEKAEMEDLEESALELYDAEHATDER